MSLRIDGKIVISNRTPLDCSAIELDQDGRSGELDKHTVESLVRRWYDSERQVETASLYSFGEAVDTLNLIKEMNPFTKFIITLTDKSQTIEFSS